VAVEKIQVPDLGSDGEVEVIEVLVKPGDKISANDSIVVLESDKAAMEIPSPKGGVVKQVLVKVGDQVKQGAPLLELESEGGATEAAKPAEATKAAAAALPAPAAKAPETAAPAAKPAPAADAASGGSSVQTIKVPDLGDASDVDVIEILVKVGDVVKAETGLVTLETDKAAMEVPSPLAGKVTAILIKVGDKVSAGSVLLDLEVSAGAPVQKTAAPAAKADAAPAAKETAAAPAQAAALSAPSAPSAPAVAPAHQETNSTTGDVYAGPAVRKFARELGVDLGKVKGTGGKGRIVKEDIEGYVKSRLQSGVAQAPAAAGMTGLPGIPDIDFSKFGAIEEVEMSKLHRVTALNMTRNWLNVPHVTQFDEADVTELEEFRAAQKALADKKGIKLTPLPFIIKACAQALAEYPQFNVSLHSSGTRLIRKKYVHIGVAVATPAGLMVPVIKDADKKSIWQISSELAALSAKAKDRKLTKEDMEGACFTISSLGNIGGNGFTPIVNAPEVAILGVSKAAIKPVYKNGQFVPRTMLPFALSYDHRAVNGVDGGMFCTYLASLLSDIRLMVL
jgi:pyruvate dehydrogenase E2 component (dihydrolipoamide acetyltransferase)